MTDKSIDKKSKSKLKYVFIIAAIIFGSLFLILSLVPNEEQVIQNEVVVNTQPDIETSVEDNDVNIISYIVWIVILICAFLLYISYKTPTDNEDINSMLNEIYNQVALSNGIYLDLSLGDNVSIEKMSRSLYYISFRKEGYTIRYDRKIIGFKIETLTDAKRDSESSLFSKSIIAMSNSNDTNIERLKEKGYNEGEIKRLMTDIGSIYSGDNDDNDKQ